MPILKSKKRSERTRINRLTSDTSTTIDVSTSAQNDTLLSDIHTDRTFPDIVFAFNQSANDILHQIVQ